MRQPIRVVGKAVRRRREVRQGVVPRLLQDLAPLAHVPGVERVVELAHDVRAHLRDLEHLRQLLGVPGDQVQEGKPLKVFGFLVRKLDDVVVALAQRLDAQLVPSLLLVQLLRGRERASMLPHSSARLKRVRSSCGVDVEGKETFLRTRVSGAPARTNEKKNLPKEENRRPLDVGDPHTKKRTRIPHELEAFASEGCKRRIGC